MTKANDIKSVWIFLAWLTNVFLTHSWKIIILILVIGAVFTGFKIQYGNLNVDQ